MEGKIARRALATASLMVALAACRGEKPPPPPQPLFVPRPTPTKEENTIYSIPCGELVVSPGELGYIGPLRVENGFPKNNVNIVDAYGKDKRAHIYTFPPETTGNTVVLPPEESHGIVIFQDDYSVRVERNCPL